MALLVRLRSRVHDPLEEELGGSSPSPVVGEVRPGPSYTDRFW
ncbi:hypothetical protein [Streptomyces sp. NPDC023588]